MDISKGKIKHKIPEAEPESDQAIDELVDMILENVHDEYHNDLEPFEIYAQKVRSQLHSNIVEFRSRFVKGYKVLIDELQKKG